jgi:organic hydroperoxide reductase OsmC/OhrA
MEKQHHYNVDIQWTGNRGVGTSGYTTYDRAHNILVEGKEIIKASSDPAFRGDASRYNPEELLLASLSSCHMLWYLHLCADNGIIVNSYLDNATGKMEENNSGGKFIEVVLRPKVMISENSMLEKALLLHEEAHSKCYIANSVNFPVRHEVEITV